MNDLKFDPNVKLILASARSHAMSLSHGQVTPLHLGVTLISDLTSVFYRAITSAGDGDISAQSVVNVINQSLYKLTKRVTPTTTGAIPPQKPSPNKNLPKQTPPLLSGTIPQNPNLPRQTSTPLSNGTVPQNPSPNKNLPRPSTNGVIPQNPSPNNNLPRSSTTPLSNGTIPQNLYLHILQRLHFPSVTGNFPQDSPSLVTVLNRAQKNLGDTKVGVAVLVISLLEDSQISDVLKEAGVVPEKVKSEVEKLRGEVILRALKTYGTDLVEQAGKLDPVIGRHREIRRVIEVLSRRTKNNPVLIGEPGVGKTAVVEGLAQRILKGDVPINLTGVKLISLEFGAMVAGTTLRGQFEERLKSVLKAVEEAQGKVVLFIDEIHMALGACKASGSTDAAKLLKPMLARGQLRFIGATTLEEYRTHVEKDAAFERRFQQVFVAEPSVPDTISILRGLKEKYEGHHGVRIQDRALVLSAQLSERYITGMLRHLFI